jgi:hypothetical protein
MSTFPYSHVECQPYQHVTTVQSLYCSYAMHNNWWLLSIREMRWKQNHKEIRNNSKLKSERENKIK